MDLFDVAFEVQRRLSELQWPFAFIGGIAIQHWGEPRFTRDVDVSLLSGFGNEEAVAKQVLQILDPRIDDAVTFAKKNRELIPLAELKEEPELVDRLLTLRDSLA